MPEYRLFVPDDAGVAIDDVVLNVYAAGTTTPSLANGITDGDGVCLFGATQVGANGSSAVALTDAGPHDIKITNGASISWLRGFDRLGVDMVQADSVTTGLPAGSFKSSTDEANTLVGIYEGDRATPADGDAMYFSYMMSDSGGNQVEVARITVKQNDVDPSADGAWIIALAVAGSLTDAFNLAVTAAGAMGVTGGVIKDEDDLSSDSATHLATQQSIKAYADAIAGAVTRDGGNTTEATTTSTSAVDLLTAASLTAVATEPLFITCDFRKTTGATNNIRSGLKLNTAVVLSIGPVTSTSNLAESGLINYHLGSRITNYLRSGVRVFSSNNLAGLLNGIGSGDMPTAVTDVIIRALTDDAAITNAHDELHVYSMAAS